MKVNILHELVKALQNSCDRKPGVIPCTRYILGEQLGELFSDSNIDKLYKGTSLLSPNNAQLLFFSEKWNPERFNTNCPKSELDFNAFLDNLRTLCNELELPEICSDEINLMIKPLLLLHFFGTPNQNLIFVPFSAKNCGYYSVPDQYEDAKSYLRQNNILFICGAPGTGKSELAKYIALSSNSFRNIGWVEATNSDVYLNNQLKEIPFLQASTNGPQNGKSSTSDILYRLKHEPEISLLIIDLPFISENDFQMIEENMNGLDIRIIFTTLTNNIPSIFSKVSLDNQPICLLKDIFESIVKTEYFSDNEFRIFAENVSNNPLIVTLAAKTIKKSPSAPSKDTWLDSSRWILYESRLEKVHTAYKDHDKNKSSYNIITLMDKLLFFYSDSFLENTADKLSVWCRQPITKDFLSNYFSHDEINDALTYGILEYTTPDDKYVKMPNILAYAIWEKYPVQYNDYSDKICEFINSFKLGEDQILSYKTLYTVIENIILRFHYQITFLSSRITLDQSNRFKNWNSQLILITKRLMHMGNYELSKKIYCNLYKYETKKEKDLILASEKLMDYISILNIPLVNATSNLHSNIFDELINELNNFKTDMKSSDSSPEESELEQLYDFLHFLLIEILDIITRIARNKSFDFIEKSAPADFLPVIPQSILSLLTREYHCYYCILNDFLAAAFHHNIDYFKEANTKFDTCKNVFLSNSDLYLKMKLYRLFFSLIMGLISANETEETFLYNPETVSDINNTYALLSKDLSKKYWSWDTNFLYVTCEILLSAVYHCTPYTDLFQKAFESSVTDLNNLITEQVTSSDSHVKEVLNLLHTFSLNNTD